MSRRPSRSVPAESRWILTETDDPEARLELPSIRCILALADVYDRVFL